MSSFSYNHAMIVLKGMEYEVTNKIDIEIQQLEENENTPSNHEKLCVLHSVKQYMSSRCEELKKQL